MDECRFQLIHTKLTDGLKVQIDTHMYTVQGEWTVLITIDPPQPPPALFKLVQKTNEVIDQPQGDAAQRLEPYQKGWRSRLATVVRECTTPRRWWRQNKQSRMRRGLVNAVGSAMNYLFGTATADQLDSIRDTVRVMAERQQRIYNDMQQFTTVLNHTFDEIQINRRHLNALSSRLYKLANIVNTELKAY